MYAGSIPTPASTLLRAARYAGLTSSNAKQGARRSFSEGGLHNGTTRAFVITRLAALRRIATFTMTSRERLHFFGHVPLQPSGGHSLLGTQDRKFLLFKKWQI